MTTVEPLVALATDTGVELVPDHARVVTRLFVAGREDVGPGDSRAGPLMDRLLALSEADVEAALADVHRRFSHRHRDLDATFGAHADLLASRMSSDAPISASRRLLIGATFTHEYSIEGAALCNPSIVLLPDDEPSDPVAGQPVRRFVMSVRGIGEGHRSSIGFRTGTVGADGAVSIDAPGRFPVTADPVPGMNHQSVFRQALSDLGEDPENVAYVIDPLGPQFTDAELRRRTVGLHAEESSRRNTARMIEHVDRLAGSSYGVDFDPATAVSERVLWPQSPAESHGMEDARFVRFVHDDGSTTYYATYTAFDGTNIRQHILETQDFLSFEVSPTAGAAATGKGLALFPRKVEGRYAALSRSDRETNSIAFSDDLRCWPTSVQIQAPAATWDLLQLGNCGSPIETEAGWLVLTHGVGAMRTYALGAILLDLHEPEYVLAASDGPIMTPDDRRRDGYVPNVIYTCGAVAIDDMLVLPYGIGDQTIAIATLSIDRLIGSMIPTPL